MRVMLLGATGLVGGLALPMLLDDPRCRAVVAPTRRALTLAHPKLYAPVLEFDALPEAPDWAQVDAVICALGSTMAQAGSREAFHRIDHDYPLAFAQLARGQGARAFVLNSAAGANAGSAIFYNRVKGELERDLRALEFASLTLVRPGLIGGQRQQVRRGEHFALRVLGVLGPVLPRAWRINPAERIARALVDAALAPPPGEHVVASSALVG
ncbi:NAD-dependent dehydratase [Stenotrophomonas forensis]|uniref:NAD-dependent dehydratase n=1 Tax=Stenotrophomonas forensis TaxID=2871169 RepID=A0ABY7Y0F4_9GAMM|nr:NAD-dependent dehydratase [Stenotrophomonas sp. DFS-20110405]WDM63458.1 NAD-dependent dehydratase [Stenotrophomonas sp. DFS-20110405]